MKLYTESDVRKAIELARLIQEKGSVEDSFDVESISGLSEICTYGWSERYSTDEISEQLTPIELPSDEEVEQYLKSFPYTKHLDDGQYNDGKIAGAELAIQWFRNKIQGGNK